MSALRIPCTHTGSLPRPDELVQLMFAVSDGIPVDQEALQSAIDDAIGEIVQRQLDAGVTVINDGEMSKPSYATYVQDRLAGFEGETVQNYFFEDLQDFPRSAEMVAGNPGRRKRKAPSCTAPIIVTNSQAAIDDMVALSAAAKARGHDQIFSSAASPGVISLFLTMTSMLPMRSMCLPLLRRCDMNMKQLPMPARWFNWIARTLRWAGTLPMPTRI